MDGGELNLKEFIGAEEAASVDRLVLYIPTKDRDGKDVDSAPWIRQGLELLSKIGGGATRLPPVEGIWHNPETDQLIIEPVTLIYSFIDPDKFDKHLDDLKRFLHSLGRETNQGEVVFEMSDRLYKIRQYSDQ